MGAECAVGGHTEDETYKSDMPFVKSRRWSRLADLSGDEAARLRWRCV
jgi:hypothetical protein